MRSNGRNSIIMRATTTALTLLLGACGSESGGLTDVGYDGGSPDASTDTSNADSGSTSDAGPKCCTGSEDCPDGHCISGVCYKLADLGKEQCWIDGDCPGGQACEGVSTCPCGAMCFVADKPGTCKGKAASCSKLDPGSFGACEMVLGYGWDGDKCVTISGCSCGNACDAIYKTMDACNKACGG